MQQADILLQIGFTCFLTIKKPRLFSGAAKVWKNVDLGKGACQLLAVGYWLLAIGYWLLAVGYWLLAVGRWPLAKAAT
jgi:hypothetical protein